MMESKVLKKMNVKQKARAKKEAAEEAYAKTLSDAQKRYARLAKLAKD